MSWRPSLVLGALVATALAACDAIVGVGDVPPQPVDDASPADAATAGDATLGHEASPGSDATAGHDGAVEGGFGADAADGSTDASVCASGQPGCVGETPATCVGGQWIPGDAACSQPTPHCSGGVCSCLGITCGAACVDPQTDAHDCGRCGHDCFGGLCSAGVCQPVLLGQGGQFLYGIAVAPTGVYFVDGSQGQGQQTIFKLALDGGTPDPIATGLTLPTSLVATPAGLFWTDPNDRTVSSLGLDGGAIVTLASGRNGPSALAADTASVYWFEGSGALERVAVDGGTVTELADGGGVGNIGEELALDAVYVYSTKFENDAGIVSKIARTGGGEIVLSSLGTYTGALAVDAKFLYFFTFTGTSFTSDSYVMPLDGGTASPLAKGLNGESVTADIDGVYWSGSSNVMMAKHGGGSPVPLPSVAGTTPGAVCVDVSSVYWITNVGAIYKVAKP